MERNLRAADPHALLDAVRTDLTDLYGSLAVELLMADYATTILQPVGTPPRASGPVSAQAGAPGRAFGAQEPVLCAGSFPGSVTAHLPVTVRGEQALARAVQSTRLLPPSQAPRAVLHEPAGHRGEAVADDDARVVCLDRHRRADTGTD